ncbi:Uncharacterised protein [Bordetella pertussis]|nr:Uncharacterised protein [Bordetella pertussis]
MAAHHRFVESLHKFDIHAVGRIGAVQRDAGHMVRIVQQHRTLANPGLGVCSRHRHLLIPGRTG